MSERDVSSHKRPRLAESGSSSSAADGPRDMDFERDTEFWYEDGTVILIASKIGFRVHRGLLAERAEVFRNIFSIPQPQDSELAVGCPVVRVSDTAIALREFLNALIREKRYNRWSDEKLESLAYRVRLAHKYGAEKLLSESLQELKILFPVLFAHYDAFSDGDFRGAQAVVAANLADLTDTPSILPTALYNCCLLADATVLQGVSLSDGTVEMLSREHLLRRSNGRVKLASRRALSIHEVFFYTFNTNCTSPGHCRSSILQMRTEAIRRLDETDVNIFESWLHFLQYNALGEEDDNLPEPCQQCMSLLYGRDEEVCRGSRELLPSYMGVEVEGWGILPLPMPIL